MTRYESFQLPPCPRPAEPGVLRLPGALRSLLATLALALGLAAPAAAAEESAPAGAAVGTSGAPGPAGPTATAATHRATSAARKTARRSRHRPGTPSRLAALQVTQSSVLLDWIAPKRRPRGTHFAVVVGHRRVARRTKHSRVTLTPRSGITCGRRYRLSVVAIDAAGHHSRRPKALIVTTTPCVEAAAPAPSTPAAAPATPATTLPPRDPAVWPFAITSPWNMPIGSGASFGGTSDPRTASLLSIASSYINASRYSIPVFTASASDPVNVIDSPTGRVSIKVPANAEQDAGTDGVLVIIDPTRTYLDEMWSTTQTGATSWSTQRHERNDLRGPGMGQRGIRASNFSVLGGLIRKWDLDTGAIRHALVMSVPAEAARKGWVWPAISEDGYASQYGGGIPLGTLFAVPPTVDVTRLGLSAEGLMLAHALQDYGVYVADTSTPGSATNTALVAEPVLEGTPQIDTMRDGFETLQALLRPVTNNTPSSIGGGGTPRVPLAPPLS